MNDMAKDATKLPCRGGGGNGAGRGFAGAAAVAVALPTAQDLKQLKYEATVEKAAARRWTRWWRG